MKLIGVHKFLFYVSTLVVIFPYFQFIEGFGGVQPYVTGIFLIIFLFISVQKIKITKPYFIFLIPIIFLILNYIYNGETNYLFYRNFFSYLTLSLIFFVYSVYLDIFNFPKKIYLYGIIVWFSAALLQVLFGDKLIGFYDLDVVANIIAIVNQIGSQGLVGLVALWILYWIFTKK